MGVLPKMIQCRRKILQRDVADNGTTLAEGPAERCRSEIADVGINVVVMINELRQC